MIPRDEATLLEVEHLVVLYPVVRDLISTIRRKPKQVVRAVDGISFSLGRSELLALVGESGCGKTTTAMSVLRLVEPVSGSIRFHGQEITQLATRSLRPLRRHIQMIYQDPYESLNPRFRVRHIVEEPLRIHSLARGKDDRRLRVADALTRAGLDPPSVYLDRYPHELSGGQRQRVAIAASLALGPELLIADEPVSMLDVSVRAGVLSVLDDLRKSGLGILMITHDLSTAAHYADRIAVMYLGRIVEEGPAKSIVHNPQHPYTKALLSVVPKRDPRHRGERRILRGETPNPIRIPSGCRFHPRCPVAIEPCKSHDPQLWSAASSVASHRAACILVEPRTKDDVLQSLTDVSESQARY